MVVAQPAHPPPAAPVGSDDHHVEFVGRFDFEPFLSSRTDRIVAREGLRHETLVSLFQRRFHEKLNLLTVRGYDSWSKAFFWHNLGEYPPTVGVRLIDQGLPLNLQRVEELEFERNLPRHIIDLVHPSKPPHQVLKRYWFTRCSDRDNLSLDQKLRRLHLRLCKIDNLRNTISHVSQSPAEDSHPVVFFVNLDSRPVELVLEGCSIPVFCQNLLGIIRHLGQHGFDRDEQSQADAL